MYEVWGESKPLEWNFETSLSLVLNGMGTACIQRVLLFLKIKFNWLQEGILKTKSYCCSFAKRKTRKIDLNPKKKTGFSFRVTNDFEVSFLNHLLLFCFVFQLINFVAKIISSSLSTQRCQETTRFETQATQRFFSRSVLEELQLEKVHSLQKQKFFCFNFFFFS